MTHVVRDFHTHIDLHCNELRHASLEKLPSDPVADVCPGRIWTDTTTNQVKFVNALGVITVLASLGDVERRVRSIGSEDFSSGTVPLVATIPDPADGSTDIDAGDWWVVKVGGTLVPAPLFGSAVVEPGDLVYAAIDNPTDNTGFYTVQTNVQVFPDAMYVERQNITAGDWANPSPGVWEYTYNSPGLAYIEDAHTYYKDHYEVFFGSEVDGSQVILTSLVDPATFPDVMLRMAGTHI